ncbi:Fatty acid hydroxylase superfamily protein [Enhygromyxa salina]|uniref:Fatty acid hydroxylase superfamily protein n=1 Tax=Enhygromyxa salina TaxID=215803 RepID=A0A2S9Y4H0_9BACT|nr:sterol desaturase family protein [Enhygromyxa salina]PRQ00003.1 Fatty acid hydroxylase superfamily protein [Enhygromyxa salina]
MIDYRVVIVLIFIAFALVEIAAGRFLFRDQTTAKDLALDIGAGIGLPVVILPLIMTASAAATEAAAPGSADALAHWPSWAMFLTLLIADDLTQYGWHRLSHSRPKLYLLHRAHHSAEYLSVRVVYRNNLLYYAMMPGLWLSGLLLYLGFAPVYYVYYIAKMAVIIGAHSSVGWDTRLLKSPRRWLRGLMWVVVRTISTPSTHAAHHGKHAADGVTHYKGNYGNFLFLWDVLFGTAKISPDRPAAFGLEEVEPASWVQELLWPFHGRPHAAALAPTQERTPP